MVTLPWIAAVSPEDLVMKSPFPGMDPYIEACGLWGDFHEALIYEIKSTLAQAVPERYLVRSGERSYLVLVEEHREAFVEIYEAEPEQRLVTTGWRCSRRRTSGRARPAGTCTSASGRACCWVT